MKVFVAAAWEPELTSLRSLTAAGVPGLAVALGPIGVGLVEAGIGMTRRIAEHGPDLALLVGTCGAIGGGLSIGDVVVASSVHLVDGAVLSADAELPAPMPSSVDLDRALHDAIAESVDGVKSVRIANTAGITVTDAHAARLAARGAWNVEHLEAFGFARACAAAGVRCAVVLAIANPVGASGREAWRASHVSASARAADAAHAALVRMSTTAPLPAAP